jgi:coatomer subunit beta
VHKLIRTLGEIKSGKVFRGVLGEYVESVSDIPSTLQEIKKERDSDIGV